MLNFISFLLEGHSIQQIDIHMFASIAKAVSHAQINDHGALIMYDKSGEDAHLNVGGRRGLSTREHSSTKMTDSERERAGETSSDHNEQKYDEKNNLNMIGNFEPRFHSSNSDYNSNDANTDILRSNDGHQVKNNEKDGIENPGNELGTNFISTQRGNVQEKIKEEPQHQMTQRRYGHICI